MRATVASLLFVMLLACVQTPEASHHPPRQGLEQESPVPSGGQESISFVGEDEGVSDDAQAKPLLEDFFDYFVDRGLDLLDVASFRLLVGPGLRFNARVTEVLQIGAGYTGPTTRDDTGFSMEAYVLGMQRRLGGFWTQRTAEAGVSLFYSYDASGRSLKGSKTTFGPSDRGLLDIGFAAHAAIAGAEAEVRLDEACDFVLGFFAIDFMGDDRE